MATFMHAGGASLFETRNRSAGLFSECIYGKPCSNLRHAIAVDNAQLSTDEHEAVLTNLRRLSTRNSELLRGSKFISV